MLGGKYMDKEKLIKHIFETVYQWGKVGLVVDEKCATFQSYMKDLEALNEPEDKPERIEAISPSRWKNYGDETTAIGGLYGKQIEIIKMLNNLNKV